MSSRPSNLSSLFPPSSFDSRAQRWLKLAPWIGVIFKEIPPFYQNQTEARPLKIRRKKNREMEVAPVVLRDFPPSSRGFNYNVSFYFVSPPVIFFDAALHHFLFQSLHRRPKFNHSSSNSCSSWDVSILRFHEKNPLRVVKFHFSIFSLQQLASVCYQTYSTTKE